MEGAPVKLTWSIGIKNKRGHGTRIINNIIVIVKYEKLCLFHL